LRAVRTLALRIVVLADGWRLLGSELHIDLAALVQELPGSDQVHQVEKAARSVAYTPDEVLAYLQEGEKGDEPAQGQPEALRREYRMESAEEVARSMRMYLEEKLASWS
jgi:hypothetical protein